MTSEDVIIFRLDNLTERTRELESSVKDLQTQINGMTSEIGALRGEVRGISRQIDTMTTALTWYFGGLTVLIGVIALWWGLATHKTTPAPEKHNVGGFSLTDFLELVHAIKNDK